MLKNNRFINLADNRKWKNIMDILAGEIDPTEKEMRDWLSFHYPEKFFQFLHEYLCRENQYSDDIKLEILEKLYNARLRSIFDKEQLDKLYWLIKSNANGINKHPSNEDITLILDLRDYGFRKKSNCPISRNCARKNLSSWNSNGIFPLSWFMGVSGLVTPV